MMFMIADDLVVVDDAAVDDVDGGRFVTSKHVFSVLQTWNPLALSSVQIPGCGHHITVT